MSRIRFDELREFTARILAAAGLDEFSNDAVTTGLCETSLRGVDSHGIRLLPHYVASALSGRKNPAPAFRFTRTFASMGCLDADNAFGHAAGMKAIDHGMVLAGETGIGAVGVQNSSHPGALASMALKAAREGFMAMAFTHADSLLKSHGGTRPFFGTNPICFAAPREQADPYCLDMATSMMPWNRLRMHRDDNTALAEGLAADGDGLPTTDPHAAACLLPVGSPMAGYKGTGLSSMIEILCAIFTGMPFGRDIPAMFTTPMEKTRHLGQFYLVMRPDGCVPAEEFAGALQSMSERVRAEPSHPDETVMLAGDREIAEAENRRVAGIPLDDEITAGLKALAAEHHIPLRLM